MAILRSDAPPHAGFQPERMHLDTLGVVELVAPAVVGDAGVVVMLARVVQEVLDDAIDAEAYVTVQLRAFDILQDLVQHGLHEELMHACFSELGRSSLVPPLCSEIRKSFCIFAKVRQSCIS